ncbi:peptide deformylase [Kocuria sp. JC486]|uniref:peptide deformylase n=1 Tax=Kocuria sp. JC486 TaxID=1970736 RepID=UPI00142240C4|nr:peptide deformylase [Kocuria sp. JC486]NHU85734.1 peptide deformylase [Kocuria sp. JC486]
MTIRPVVITGDPVLHRPAAKVTAFDDDLRSLIADMHETMDAAHGVGLAAPQIGVGLRIFTFVFANDDDAPDRGEIINPVLTLGKVSEQNPDPDEESEGCLSVPGLSYPLKRADWVKIAGFDPHGNPIGWEANGWFARVMQHEYDHLDGKLYVDRLNAKWSKKAKKVIRSEGWGTPGNTWQPGVDDDPFGHGEE